MRISSAAWPLAEAVSLPISISNRDGIKVYTTEVVVEDQEFAQSMNEQSAAPSAPSYEAPAAPAPDQGEDPGEGFMNLPEGVDEELPFN